MSLTFKSRLHTSLNSSYGRSWWIFPHPSSPKRRYLDLALSVSAAFTFSFDHEDREGGGGGGSCCMGRQTLWKGRCIIAKRFFLPLCHLLLTFSLILFWVPTLSAPPPPSPAILPIDTAKENKCSFAQFDTLDHPIAVSNNHKFCTGKISSKNFMS